MKNGRASVILYIILLMVGTGLLLYPTLSNYYNTFHQSKAITQYAEITKELSAEEIEALTKDAKEYNKALITDNTRWKMTDEERKVYNNILDISGTGVMGYIEIPKVNISLPIYHGTSNEILQIAVGHVEGSSFPIGGTGTHAVLSGHRGLPSAKLFTDLDKMEEGDCFYIKVLNDVLTYQIDQILIVEPNNMDSLEIDPTQDYCTLVTCTPYGVNSHRMLIRGKRIETIEEKNFIVSNEAIQIEPRIVMPFILAFLCIMYILFLIFKPKRKSYASDL